MGKEDKCDLCGNPARLTVTIKTFDHDRIWAESYLCLECVMDGASKAAEEARERLVTNRNNMLNGEKR